MTFSAQQKIRVGFGLLLILPTVLCILAVLQTERLIHSAESVRFTERVLSHLNETFSMLKDVEVDQREYMLTGDQAFLDAFKKSQKNVAEQLTKVANETDKNTRLRYSIEILQSVIEEKFREVDKTNEIRQTGGLEAASAAVKNNLGKGPMDNIRTLITQMIATERATLQQNEQRTKSTFRLMVIVFAVVLLLNFFFVLFIRYFMQREAAEHEREEQRFRDLNIELERRVEQRTEELQRSNEDLQQFAYMVSHDLKEPLRMVASYTELLQRRYAGRLDADADEFIGFAMNGVRRMAALIEDMLTYSRASELPADKMDPISAQEALDAALDNLRIRISETGATVTSDQMPVVEFDPVRLTQLFQNLIGNALKYRRDVPPVVHVGVKQDGRQTVFSVQDNGIGIDPDQRDKVFGVFQRLHAHEFEGTGIGLATCKKIVERRGGTIWFDSEPGKGSTFYFTIPVSTEKKKSAPDKQLVARG
jgi:signal transduction histidine kinase